MKKNTAQPKTLSPIKTNPLGRLTIPSVAVLLVLGSIGAALYLNQTKKTISTSTPAPTPIVSTNPNLISLPTPEYKSSHSLESVLKSRRTKRDFLPSSLTLKQVSQMLWAGQGVTADWGGRTAPSAKSTYPLTLYLIANNVEGLEKGVYQYIPGERIMAHQLSPVKLGDFKESIFKIAKQNSTKEPAALIVVTGNMKKMADAFAGVTHDNEVYLEAGHVGQNLYLEAESLGIGMVTLSSIDPVALRSITGIPENLTPIYTIPFGHPKE